MTELSPFDELATRHTHGYFRTHGGSFRMEALAGGRTRLVEHTSHSLLLAPSAYWLPMARWVVGENHGRVLRHIKREAEGAAVR
jgi:hypothetical protein